MNLYHYWIYENVLNTEWFIWSFVIAVLGFNIISPLLVWLTMSGRTLFNKKKKNQYSEAKV